MLLPLAGCASTANTRPNLLSTGKPVTADRQPPSELPPRQAAAACLATAEELAQAGYEREAIVQYEKARVHDPKLDSSHKLAVFYDRQGDDSLAFARYQQAIKASPKDAGLLNDFGYFHYTRGNWPDAEKLLRQATELNPQHARAWTNLGMTLGQQGRFDDSFAAFAKVVSQAEARTNVALFQARYGQTEEARQSLQLALEADPQLSHARSLLAAMDVGETVQR